jgi:hypothetical protein
MTPFRSLIMHAQLNSYLIEYIPNKNHLIPTLAMWALEGGSHSTLISRFLVFLVLRVGRVRVRV